MRHQLRHGDSLDVLKGMESDSIDAVVTDPPAGIGFMGKRWDDPGALVERRADTSVAWDRVGGNHHPADTADKARTLRSEGARFRAFLEPIFVEMLRVTKPGGHALVWALPRTSHWTATALEDAGWEIRDSLHHVFGSGFPKSMNLGSGRGTALKPAHEVWWLVRKPFAGTVAGNVAKWGVGGLNIDGCRVAAPGEVIETHSRSPEASDPAVRPVYGEYRAMDTHQTAGQEHGRFPPNFLLSHAPDCVCVGTREVKREIIDATAKVNASDGWGNMQGSRRVGSTTETIPAWDCAEGCPVAAMDKQSGDVPTQAVRNPDGKEPEASGVTGWRGTSRNSDHAGETGGASRFFPTFAWEAADFVPFLYEAKAARSERESGLDGLKRKQRDDSRDPDAPGANNPRNRGGQLRANVHPTVKPVSLMRWLCRLVTPENGLILDPFLGSGTTGIAALREGFRFVGIEREADYLAIAQRRIEEDAPLFNRRTA